MTGFKLRPTALESLFLGLYLLISVGEILGNSNGPGVKVVVEEGSDAVLPCLISTKENIVAKLFDWKKDGQKEVFLYDSGIDSNNGGTGQDLQFKGRVSHFQDQLKNGNASIKIQNTKVTDSGNYSCIFPDLQPSQTFYIELVVGASPRPYITILKAPQDGQLLLQCEVLGASPKPKVQWLDSAGDPLSTEEPRVTERENHFYITVLTTVTKADNFRCVATQEEIGHETFAETYVPFSEKLCEDSSTKEVTGWLFGGIIIGAVVLAVVQALLLATKRITVTHNQGADPEPTTTSAGPTKDKPLLQVGVTADHQNGNVFI